MCLSLDRCVGSAPFVASGLGRILIGKHQAIFQSTQGTSGSSESGKGMNVDSVGSHTGGKGCFTQWGNGEFIVITEAIHPHFTQWVNYDYFSNVPTNLPTF